MPNIEVSPKIAATIIVVVLVIAGLLIYRGVAGSGSAAATERGIQAMHEKMLKVPGSQPAPPAAPAPPTR